MAKNVITLKHNESPQSPGMHYRLVCLTGAGRGESHILNSKRIVIGRGDKADIRINDTKASREHAEIVKKNDEWVITDLGSQNGLIINDGKITQCSLKEGDRVIIGQTVFKFSKIEGGGQKSNPMNSEQDPKRQQLSQVAFIVLVLIIVVVFFSDETPTPNQTKVEKEGVNTLQNVSNEFSTALQKRQQVENKQIKEKLNVIYQRGARELREGNYYRAIHEFNLALIMAPGDSHAEYYLRKTKEKLDKEIEGFTANAQRDEVSLKYKSAIISYCAIIRLLYTAPDDPRHKNAVQQIKNMELKLGMETGETDCIKKQRQDS
jgi:pSer/pThr/pTyr-binding forkhead associated (FHA) protein